MGLFREVGRRVERLKQDATEAAKEGTEEADDDPDVERADRDGEPQSESDADGVDDS